ncbi:NADH dehydrogenase [ubiquinone] 1 beta subcomplex subunit 10-like [Ruditapes philippinarum]|uniref:NADH dehydrogenase [ubiquinone] 1 beta subcomplex subunit 10-like n=1 Tax=Ruditapes philippinarum TaxID=129788 RepID=UPI001E6B4511
MSSTDGRTDGPETPLERYIPADSFQTLKKPVKFIREKFVLPFRSKDPPVYYHRRFERVPTIDQCEVDDPLCRYEANIQFIRDKQVDSAIIKILRRRLTECRAYWNEDAELKCQKEHSLFVDNLQNWFVKYGEMGFNVDVVSAYMKQKHRMIWLRRKHESGETDLQYRD